MTQLMNPYNRINEMPNLKRAHAWIFPPSPVTNGVLLGMNDAMALELVSLIRDCCTDENGHPLVDGANPDLLAFASRLEQNVAVKASRKSDRE